VKQFVGRLLIFFVGIPVVGAAVILLPYQGNIGFVALIIAFSALGGAEAAAFFKEGRTRVGKAWGSISGAIVPSACYLSSRLAADTRLAAFAGAFAAIAFAFLVILATEVFRKTEKIESILDRSISRIFPILYPGVLSASMVMIGGLEGGNALILLFLAISFGNDSFAWACGMLFGRKRNIIAVSPNKSIAGFLGGVAASTGAGLAARAIAPGAMGGSYLSWAIVALVTGIASTLGDLAESALKRSAGIKDSGSIVPGRGGVLDSIDSLLFAAPFFYGSILAMEAIALR
jgi:phosphatidate cytidylyltransferase